MSQAEAVVALEAVLFGQNARIIRRSVQMNADGISHEESLVAPQPAGSCANWIVGHLAHIYEQSLPFLGQPTVLEEGALKRYGRGSEPIGNGSEAHDFADLLRVFDEASERFEAGLANLDAAALATTRSFFGGKSETTLSKYLNFILFHQAYHAGQLGVLRRIVGKEGAIPCRRR